MAKPNSQQSQQQAQAQSQSQSSGSKTGSTQQPQLAKVKKETTPSTPSTPVAASPTVSTPTASTASAVAKKETIEKSPEPRSQHESSPHVEVVQKRLKTLKKRLERIEKNEEQKAQGQTLDGDQLRSIGQKQEVKDSIREFEEIIKQLEECDAEEVRKAQRAQKKVAAEEAKKIQAVRDEHFVNVQTLLKYLSVLNLFGVDEVRKTFVGGGVEGLVFTENDLQTLDILVAELYSRYDPSVGLHESSKSIHNKINKLLSRSSDVLFEGSTYAQAMDLLVKTCSSSFFDPVLAAELKAQREAAEAAAERARIEDEQMQASYEFVDHGEIPHFDKLSLEQINGLPGPMVAFINASDVLGESKPVVAFDGSPSVIVPLPHSLIESLSSPHFSYASRVAPTSSSSPSTSSPSSSSTATPTSAVATAAVVPATIQHQHQHQHHHHGQGGSATDLEQLIAQQQQQPNGAVLNERGGHRGGSRGGASRRGGNGGQNGGGRPNAERNHDNTQFHKSYERNHDREYGQQQQQQQPQQQQQQPRRGGASGSGSGNRGSGRGGHRGGHVESPSSASH